MTDTARSNQGKDLDRNQPNVRSASRCNPGFRLTEADSAAMAALLRQSRDEVERRTAELGDVRVLEARRALNAATRELFARNSDFQETAQKLADRIKPDLYRLKPLGGGFSNMDGVSVSHAEIFKELERLRLLREAKGPTFADLLEEERLRLLRAIEKGPSAVLNPPFAGELWWGETHPLGGGPGLAVDVGSDPARIWGHIAYDGDPLLGGSIGISMFFFLTPDRFPMAKSGSLFEIHPRVQISGWASGWTGLYHPIWHADDKWSKCWQVLRMSATLSSGELLDSETLNLNLFFLENISAVGQANVDLTMGWQPVLRFGADLTDLRTRGVSIVLEASFRYDYQLEGDSDLWLRNRPGSNAESVAGFDNAVHFRMFPGSVLVV